MFKTLLFSTRDNIATITFNRPEMMNAFNGEMAAELALLTERVRNDSSIRALLLNGTGGLFMAGGDIKFFHDRLDTMPEGVMDIVRTLNIAITNFMQMPKPVLASVHGSVAGVGISLMLACDLVIAAENTKFTTAYSGIGISPDGGASYHLPRLAGSKKAMEWLLFADIFDAAEAKAYGLINWVVPQEKLEDQTHKILRKLVSGPLQSYIKIKQLVNETWHTILESQLEREGRAFEACSSTSDFKSGVKGFLSKKRPKFSGQ